MEIELTQNIWEKKKGELQKQKRRAQVVSKFLRSADAKMILDVGCAEGFVTNFLRGVSDFVVGIEVNLEYLKIARQKVKEVDFVNASIFNLPFRANFFDSICILEVLEHLNQQEQAKGLEEVNRVLANPGNLIISIPYKESIIQTTCIHCKKKTPLYGHLRSMDESDILALLPESQYRFSRIYHLPSVQMVSCRPMFDPLPLTIWMLLNNFLSIIKIGYWAVLHFKKEGKDESAPL